MSWKDDLPISHDKRLLVAMRRMTKAFRLVDAALRRLRYHDPSRDEGDDHAR